MTEFKELIKKTVDKLLLVIWAPYSEEQESEIDISFGLIFKSDPNKLFVISVEKNELWTPYISTESIPKNKYSWEDFYPRIKVWMNSKDENLSIGKEYYEVTKSELFSNIIGEEIKKIELLKLEDNPEPFGVKLHFKHDYIVSMPNSDGNTVETKFFNKNNSLDNFKRLGNVIYSKV